MKILIQQAYITDLLSPHHGTTQDILIDNGIIVSIGSIPAESAYTIINRPNIHVSTGWVDLFSNFADPGQEYKETLETGANAAAAGGYTDVFVIPDTKPVVDIKAQVEYIRQKSRSLPVNVLLSGPSQRSSG